MTVELYLRKRAHARVPKHIPCCVLQRGFVRLFCYKDRLFPPFPTAPKSSTEKKRNRKSASGTLAGEKFSLLMFDVVVLACGGEARQHHKDARASFYGKGRFTILLFLLAFIGVFLLLVIRSAVSSVSLFFFALMSDISSAGYWMLVGQCLR